MRAQLQAETLPYCHCASEPEASIGLPRLGRLHQTYGTDVRDCGNRSRVELSCLLEFD